MAREQLTLNRCRTDAETCPSYAAQFLRLIGAVNSKSGRAKLEEANRAVNMAIRYVSDYTQHGEADRWSAPLASFATAKGDCEDYAIAKYAVLREAGVARENLQLVLVRDRAVRQDHAVLAARLDDRWLILDNRQSLLIEDFERLELHAFVRHRSRRGAPVRRPLRKACAARWSECGGTGCRQRCGHRSNGRDRNRSRQVPRVPAACRCRVRGGPAAYRTAELTAAG